jgi:mRNA-degrading endonuclease RelE of RelBE toxin-antitoxin system
MRFEILYTPKAVGHLATFPKTEQVKITDRIDELLGRDPTLSTRKRKLLRPNPVALWELRIGDIRVFYDVQGVPMASVIVKAIGKKVHNELWIGNERIRL